MSIIVAGGSVKELWLSNAQWGYWANKMLCTSQPTIRRLFEDEGAPVFSWVKHANDARRREVVSEELDKYGINLVNARMTYREIPTIKW